MTRQSKHTLQWGHVKGQRGEEGPWRDGINDLYVGYVRLCL